VQPQHDELIGATLGNYRILAPLGQGGMARVYRARQENLDREVAIKVLPPWYAADRSFVERFNLEARLVARLSHPNIVTVHDASEYNGLLYIVMQLVDGGTLKQRLDQLRAQGKTMDLAEAAHIFRQLADALSYAHDQGIIHRDVKPVNVLMDRSGRPILSDFGIAKVLASSHEQLTRPGAGVGTPEYMSPEQCMGGQIDGRADIYALGVMLYEALTGRTPFIGDNYPALAHSHLYEPPSPPSRFNPTLPPPVERVILTALMKDPAQRYQRASELADALDLALHATGRLPAYQPAYPRERFASAAPQLAQAAPAASPGLSVAPGTAQPRTTGYLCPNCQHLNKPHMRYCTRCGCPINQCPGCGRIHLASTRFCTACGHALSPVPV
jgi:serine/threonine protein kinase